MYPRIFSIYKSISRFFIVVRLSEATKLTEKCVKFYAGKAGDSMTDTFLSKTLWETRIKGKRSQEYMALEMGVARKTIQNWEKGISAPSIEQAIEWFRILQISPLPYLFQYVYPQMQSINAGDEDQKLRQNLITLIEQLPPEGIRQLLYLFYGNHGSSPRAVLNLMTEIGRAHV